MTDITGRLRQSAGEFWAHRYEADVLLIDAADEIERLRSCEEAMHEGSEIIIELKQEIERLRKISAAMAEDDGLWFRAETAAEAYVQQELRKLCAAIEGVSPDDCARAVLEQKP